MKRFVFITLHADYWPVRQQCQLLGVSPNGYYAWRKHVPTPAATLGCTGNYLGDYEH